MMKEQSMTSKSTDCSSQGPPQGENAAAPSPQPGPPEHQSSRSRNQVFKSGPLFISSKGIGWTSWKKRWFILTRTSLVFFRSDPSSAPQKGGEVNLTLGGIDLNNSASVEVKTDKKLLTVFFPDGRDGRAFTLKAETLEDLQEWKTALENALAQAPIATNNAGQNGILKNDQTDSANGAGDQQKDGPPGKSMVIGRPILLALEDIDGSPSFLEKALRFMEDHGSRIEGILRQAADVDDVYRRVREYEQGKNEFSPDEDAHVIADCIKYILRELPSSPVPASCCNALLEAFRSDRNNRLNAMRTAILETFPEPNRRLLQRILLMMQTVISNKTVNRMSTSAVAACMSPLLLRPLLAGDCELEGTPMDVAGDGSFQLLQAAAAANHAQAIVITLLDEYDKIFGEGSMSDGGLFSDSDESGSGTEEASDDDMYEEDDDDYHEDDDHEDVSDDHDETDDDYEHSVTETCSGSGDHGDSDSYDDKHSERSSLFSKSPERASNHVANQRSSSVSPRTPEPLLDRQQSLDDNVKRNDNRLMSNVDTDKLHSEIPAETSTISESDSSRPPSPKTGRQLSATKFLGSSQFKRLRWGRTSAKKNLSMESIDFVLEDEDEIQRLEAEKIELQNQIEEEANGNAILQASLERRKKALHERRLALEKEVARLQEQLQKERDLRASLEAGSRFDEKFELQKITLAEVNFGSLKQRLDDIDAELTQQHEQTAVLLQDRNNKGQESFSQGMLLNNRDDVMKNELQHVEKSNKNEARQNNNTDGAAYDGDRKNDYAKGQCKYNNDGADCDSDWKIESAKLKIDFQGQKNDKLGEVHRDNDQKIETANKNQKQTIDPKTDSRNKNQKQPNDQKNESSANKDQNPPKDQKNESANIYQNQLNDEKNESADKNQSHSFDASRGGSSKFGWIPNDAPFIEPAIPKPIPSASKKSSSKSEGSSSTTSALSKLTTRLNFLKERRNQIATELQSIDKGRGSSTQSALSPGKVKIPEPIYTVHNPSNNQGPEGSFPENVENRVSPSSHSSGKGTSIEVDDRGNNKKTDNKDSNKKTDNKDRNNKTDDKDRNNKTDNRDDNKIDSTDGNKKGSGSKSDAASSSQQNQQQTDRIKSEGVQSSSKNSDKGRRQDGQQSNTCRTLSR